VPVRFAHLQAAEDAQARKPLPARLYRRQVPVGVERRRGRDAHGGNLVRTIDAGEAAVGGCSDDEAREGRGSEQDVGFGASMHITMELVDRAVASLSGMMIDK